MCVYLSRPDSPLSDKCSVHICFEIAYRGRTQELFLIFVCVWQVTDCEQWLTYLNFALWRSNERFDLNKKVRTVPKSKVRVVAKLHARLSSVPLSSLPSPLSPITFSLLSLSLCPHLYFLFSLILILLSLPPLSLLSLSSFLPLLFVAFLPPPPPPPLLLSILSFLSFLSPPPPLLYPLTCVSHNFL